MWATSRSCKRQRNGLTRCVQLFATPWTIAHQVPPSMGFSRQDTGVSCHALLQGIFPTQGSNPCLLQLLHCKCILHHWATSEALLGSRRNHLYWQLDLSLGSLIEILPPEGWDSKHAPWGHEVWDDLLQQRQEAHLPSPGQLLAAPAKDQARRGLQVGTPERTAWSGEYHRHPFFSSAYTLSRKTQNLCASWIKGP